MKMKKCSKHFPEKSFGNSKYPIIFQEIFDMGWVLNLPILNIGYEPNEIFKQYLTFFQLTYVVFLCRSLRFLILPIFNLLAHASGGLERKGKFLVS